MLANFSFTSFGKAIQKAYYVDIVLLLLEELTIMQNKKINQFLVYLNYFKIEVDKILDFL